MPSDRTSASANPFESGQECYSDQEADETEGGIEVPEGLLDQDGRIESALVCDGQELEVLRDGTAQDSACDKEKAARQDRKGPVGERPPEIVLQYFHSRSITSRGVARALPRDEVMVETTDGRVTLVHLTCSGHAESPPWPSTDTSTSAEHLEQTIEFRD